MNEIVVRDRSQNVIGVIQTESDGRKTVRDHNMSVLGFFDPRADVTRDAQSRIFGMGDQTMGLIHSR